MSATLFRKILRDGKTHLYWAPICPACFNRPSQVKAAGSLPRHLIVLNPMLMTSPFKGRETPPSIKSDDHGTAPSDMRIPGQRAHDPQEQERQLRFIGAGQEDMTMSKASEERTKGMVAKKLASISGYPSKQDVKVDGITWFKEDSYKGSAYDWLADVFATASKKQTRRGKGTPDFVITKDGSNVILVVECKGDINKHSTQEDASSYQEYGYGSPEETENYAINGALWYASYLCDKYDVIAIAVSGQNEYESKVTSFVWPKNGTASDILLLEEGNIQTALISIHQYKKDVDVVLKRFAKTEYAIKKELRRYTLTCANFLRSNGIEDNSKAGFVSAIILGLTNH